MSQPSPLPSDLSDPQITAVSGVELTTRQLHDILHLRVDVFVVEQECAYPEIDGRDLSADTTHLWIAGEHEPPIAAYLRVLTDQSGRRIGRVVTHSDARGQRLASALMEQALAITGSEPVTLDAQSYLTSFYQAFGFEPSGPEFVEDGIPHVPMARPAPTAPAASSTPSPTTGAPS